MGRAPSCVQAVRLLIQMQFNILDTSSVQHHQSTCNARYAPGRRSACQASTPPQASSAPGQQDGCQLICLQLAKNAQGAELAVRQQWVGQQALLRVA